MVSAGTDVKGVTSSEEAYREFRCIMIRRSSGLVGYKLNKYKNLSKELID